MSSLPPPVSRKRMGTTSTTSSRTSLSHYTSEPTCFQRAFRVLICARFALALATRRPQAENKLNSVYGTKYRINLDHPILTDHGVFYPQGLYNDLVFELTLAPAGQVVNGSDASKLVYKLENIQLEYEVIRSKALADMAASTAARSSPTTSLCTSGWCQLQGALTPG